MAFIAVPPTFQNFGLPQPLTDPPPVASQQHKTGVEQLSEIAIRSIPQLCEGKKSCSNKVVCSVMFLGSLKNIDATTAEVTSAPTNVSVTVVLDYQIFLDGLEDNGKSTFTTALHACLEVQGKKFITAAPSAMGALLLCHWQTGPLYFQYIYTVSKSSYLLYISLNSEMGKSNGNLR